MDAKFFSSIKKYKKSNTIGFESVPLNIKIGFFGTKKEHTFFGVPHIYYSIPESLKQCIPRLLFLKNYRNGPQNNEYPGQKKKTNL